MMKTTELPCSFCHHQGKDRFGLLSRSSTCVVCRGRKIIRVPAPYIRCAHCRGTGAIKRFTCNVCQGKGVIAKPVKPTIVCPVCQGSGDDQSESVLDCLTCRGRGWIFK